MGLDTALSAGALALSGLAYNRDGYSDNVQLRQNQSYQEKNYYITWIAAVREEVRDIMTIFVGRMSNYNVVSTLIAAIVAGAICEGEPAASCPDFVAHAFYFSMYLSAMYLFLAVLYATRGMTVAYNSSMAFLVAVVPDPLDKYDHDYMQQVTKNFEQDLQQVFRIPLWSVFGGAARKVERTSGCDRRMKFAGRKVSYGDQKELEQLPRGGDPARTDSSLTCGRVSGTQLDTRISSHSYFESLRMYSELWEPFANSAEESLAHGILCLTHGSVYYCLGRLHDRSLRWAALTILGMFVILAAVMFSDGGVSGSLVRDQASTGRRRTKARHSFRRSESVPCWEVGVLLLGVSGPVSIAIADRAAAPWTDDIFVPLSYLFHAMLCCTFSVCAFKCTCAVRGGRWLPDPTSKYKAAADLEVGGEKDANQTFPEAPTAPRSFSSVKAPGFDVDSCLQGVAAAAPAVAVGVCSPPSPKPVDIRHDPEDLLIDLLQQSRQEIRENMQTLRLSTGLVHAVASFAWLSLLCWSVYLRIDSLGSTGPVAEIEDVPVSWPSPYFRPEHLACARGRVFVADRFSVYELVEGSLRPWACNMSQNLLEDVVVACEGDMCWPQALGRGGTTVLDCGHAGAQLPLLQTPSNPDHIAALGTDRLAVQLGGDLLEYQWDSNLHGFRPLWPLTDLDPTDMRALDIAQDGSSGRQLVVFRSAMTLAEGRKTNQQTRRAATVEVQPLLSLRPGVPRLPTYNLRLPRSLPPLHGGCVLDNQSMMVLTQGEDGLPQIGRLRVNISTGVLL